jgi:Tfp pilus assembly protein PilF
MTLVVTVLSFVPPPVSQEPMPLTGLPPAPRPAQAAAYSYRIATDSAECQAHFDHGLAQLYAKKWPEAAQSFETAASCDPKCALTWWALSRALEGWGKESQADALKKAQALLPLTGDRERMLVTARLQDKGLSPGGKRAAAKTLDELLTLYGDDEEAWFYRAACADDDARRVPYWLALRRLNPRHPGANAELQRFHEANKNTSLAKLYADDATKSEADAKPPEIVDAGGKLKMSGLAPSKLAPKLCVYRYRITTTSPECQAFFDQGLGYFYSYVWMEAARSFETALQHDPENPMAWWGLSRALEKWSKSNHTQALEKAHHFLDRASQRERLLVVARLQEKGLWPGVGPTERRPAATKTLDELLALYDDDEEAWYARAELADAGVQRVPLFKALLRLDPLHPGANHELVHFFDNYRRPALGWPYAEQYIKSSPGIPHAFHMQAHLGTRIGRWDKSTEYSARAVELERAYHKEMNVPAKQDSQYSHHLEVLTRSLVHDGRFREARAAKTEGSGLGYRFTVPWFRLHVAERDYAEALKVAEQVARTDKGTGGYMKALAYLHQGDATRAAAEVEALTKAGGGIGGQQSEPRRWEVEGWLKCLKGEADEGLKLMAKAVERTKNDYSHHAWGDGAYYMEVWGIAALQAEKLDVAEEAFLEALAHDPGSVRGALGLNVLCERQGRADEAARYADLAKRLWKKADPGALEKEWAALKERRPPMKPDAAKTPEKPVEDKTKP